MEFKDPWILILIPFCLGVLYVLNRRKMGATFRFPTTELFLGLNPSWKVSLSNNLHFLRLIILAIFLMALAGPRSVLEKTEVKTEGIDIILTVDISGSMAAEDFKLKNKRVNRLAIVKDTVEDFVEGRSSDRMGLIVFAGLAYTVCPLTTDYDWLIANLQRIRLNLIEQEGTAIGSAITSSISRLQESQAKSKVIILLTDGVHNAGKVDPIKAAEAAKTLGIKIYTIGAGSKGLVPFPVQDLFGRRGYQRLHIDLDENTLKEIAKITDGLYFRATDTESLRKIYQQIDKLEKTDIQETGYKEYKQLFGRFLSTALILLVLELTLSQTILMRIP